MFAQSVSEATEGRFQIDAFGAGELVPAFSALDAVAEDVVEMCLTASSFFWGKDPTFSLVAAAPFGLNARMQCAWMYDMGGIDLLNEFFHTFNVHGLPAGQTGTQMGGWFRREVTNAADFEGLRFRTTGLSGAVLSEMGAVPLAIPTAEIYPAMEKGVVDAAEWVGPYDDEKLGFHKVAKYYYYPSFWEGAYLGHLFINLDRWNSLPASYQRIIELGAVNITAWMMARRDVRNPPALRRMLASGVQLRPFSPEIRGAAFEASARVCAALSQSNSRFKALYETIVSLRREQYEWQQVSDLAFDEAMVSLLRGGKL